MGEMDEWQSVFGHSSGTRRERERESRAEEMRNIKKQKGRESPLDPKWNTTKLSSTFSLREMQILPRVSIVQSLNDLIYIPKIHRVVNQELDSVPFHYVLDKNQNCILLLAQKKGDLFPLFCTKNIEQIVAIKVCVCVFGQVFRWHLRCMLLLIAY